MKRIIISAGAIAAFLLGYGVVGHAYPAGGVYGRGEYRGYFANNYDADLAGTYVFPNDYYNASVGYNEAYPSSINTAAKLIAFVEGKLSGDNQEKTGAAFLIQSMRSNGISGGTVYRGRPPTPAEILEWENIVKTTEAHTHITWRAGFTHNINSYYMGVRGGSSGASNDDAFYDDNASNVPSMIFRDENNAVWYVIKWQCSNPLGYNSILDPPHPWSAQGNTTVSDGNPDPGDTATNITTKAGDTLHFIHSVHNLSSFSTAPDNIWYSIRDDVGNIILPSQNSSTYSAGQTKTFPEDVVVPGNAAPGAKYCRRIIWDWKNSWKAGDPGYGTAGAGPVVCATVGANFNLSPQVLATVNGVASSTAEVGDQIIFTYSVYNSGATSSTVDCHIYGLKFNGYYATPSPPDNASNDGSYTPPPTGCPRNFANGPTSVGTDLAFAVPAADLNKTICRSLYVDQATSSGPPAGDEVCVRINAKPYTRVYGGDVSAGNGLDDGSGSCSSGPNASNFNAAIVGWNRGMGQGYAGAGVQYAAMALSKINDFASALGYAGTVNAPSGLALANTSPSGSNFGGDFGSLPCIPNYYATRPTTPLPSPPATITDMTTGVYGTNGNVYFQGIGGGVIDVGERITLYVDGDIYINTNVIYAGSWSTATMPLFRVIARGNIYLDLNVAQLDGLYVAQAKADGTGGVIYTCSTTIPSQAPIPPSSSSFHSLCDNQRLIANGAFVARQVQLGRTQGTLSQGTAGETGATGFAAEVFNYGPIMWIPQPAPTSTAEDYDAITSLPPIL